jgi:hypothetical protein
LGYDTISINNTPLIPAQRNQKDVYPNTGYFDELERKANDQDQETGIAEESTSTRHGTDRARFGQINQRTKKRRR